MDLVIFVTATVVAFLLAS
jgi:hypothetical protein